MHFGAIPSPKDDRDYQFSSIAGASSAVIPYHSDVKDIIVDQLHSSQCGACSAIAARYETEHRQNGSTKNLSHTYVYGNDTDYDGEGMYLRTVMKIACDGIPYSTDWESWGMKTQCRELCQRNVTESIKQEAHKLRGSYYYACNTWNEVCNAVRATNGAVVIMMPVYSSWSSVGRDGIVGENSGDYLGNHFLRVKDYEILDGGVLKIRCQNSWGASWGDGGYCYFYSNIHMFSEAMCIIDNINEVVRKLTFTDVEDGRWSAKAIEWCAENGIISGYEDGTFRPEEFMTREQVASVLYRMANK